MLLADPLSRLCSPSSGFFDPTLPAKLQALLKYRPVNLKKHENVRVYAYKDTAALSRHVQLWRELKNPISQGRLATSVAKDSFHLGIMHSDGPEGIAKFVSTKQTICSTLSNWNYF